MIIRRLKVKNYRRFEEKELLFAKGVNIVIGNNEAGKSTITHAILDALFTDPSTRSKETLNRITSWKGAGDALIELEFEHDGGIYLLVKDFAKKEAYIENLDTGKTATNYEDVQGLITKFLGISSKEIFLNTAFISHSDIAKIDTNKDFLNAIQNVATESAEEISLQGVLSDLNSEIKKLRLGLDRPSNNPGPIKYAKTRVAELEKEISAKSGLVAKVNESAKQGTDAEAELQKTDARVQEIEELLSNYNIYEKASKNIKEIDENIKQYESKIIAYNEIQSKLGLMSADLNVYAPFKKLDSDKAARDLTALVETRKSASNELNRISVSEYKNESLDKKDTFVKIFGTILVLGLTALAYVISNDFLITIIVGVLLGTILLVTLYFLNRTEKVANKAQANVLKQAQDNLKYRVQEASQSIQKILDDFHCEDVSSFFTNKARFGLIMENIKQAESRMAGLLTNTSINDIKSRQLELIKEKKEIETTELTDKIKKSKVSSQEYFSLERELGKLNQRQKELERMLTTAQVRVNDAEVDSDYITKTEEELELTKTELAKLLSKAEVYQLTYDTIKIALKETAKTAGAIVEAEIQKDLPALTLNRYSKARVEDDLSIKVFSAEKNEWANPIDELSSGTTDQIYFLTRIGFIRALVKQAGIPIICDDPFVTFDDDRKENLKTIVEALCKDYQFIIFTLSKDYAEWGNINRL